MASKITHCKLVIIHVMNLIKYFDYVNPAFMQTVNVNLVLKILTYNMHIFFIKFNETKYTMTIDSSLFQQFSQTFDNRKTLLVHNKQIGTYS